LVTAIPLALIGVTLIAGVFAADSFGDDPALGVLYGTLTALCYSGFILILRHGGQDLRQPAGPLFDATLVSTIVAVIAGTVTGDLELAPSWPAHGWLVVLALTSQVLGWLLISMSLPRLPAALLSVLLTIQPVGSVLLGIVLLDEEPTWSQLIGVGLILAGVVLAAARRPAQEVEKVAEAAGP
jgi:drug/metabolite transporter (DMT)-like permease